MTRQPIAGPIYQIDDIVYLKASAVLGFLESYKITNLFYDPARNTWVYSIDLKPNPSGAPTSIGDHITLKNNHTLFFIEDELITFCDAAHDVKSNLELRLARIIAQLEARCGGTA